MHSRIPTKTRQSGQTLIETMVGIFILVTGLASAIGLAIYSFNATSNTTRQVVATSLAREGVEAVKNIRDSNWLNDSLVDCSADLGSGQLCYAQWRGIGAPVIQTGDYSVDFTVQNGASGWLMNSNPASYSLNFDSYTGRYHNGGSGTQSVYSRQVHIDEDQTSPYTAANPKVIVTSTVWWTGRSCVATTDPTTLPNSCKVVLKMYLTNWRNY